MDQNANCSSADSWMIEDFAYSLDGRSNTFQYLHLLHPPVVLPCCASTDGSGERSYCPQHTEFDPSLSQEQRSQCSVYSADNSPVSQPSTVYYNDRTFGHTANFFGPEVFSSGSVQNGMPLEVTGTQCTINEFRISGPNPSHQATSIAKSPKPQKWEKKKREQNPCIRCQQASKGCDWPDKSGPCTNCEADSRAVVWRIPCVHSYFAELLESGPCTTVIQRNFPKQSEILALLQWVSEMLNQENKAIGPVHDLAPDGLVFQTIHGDSFLPSALGISDVKASKNLGKLGHFQSSQKCYFRPIAERLTSSTHLVILILMEAQRPCNARRRPFINGQLHDRSIPLLSSSNISNSTSSTGILLQDMTVEAAEILQDFVRRETESEMFQKLEGALKQCSSFSGDGVSLLARCLLRAIIWTKSARGKARASGLSYDYIVGYEERNQQLSLRLYIRLRYLIEKPRLPPEDPFWKEVDKFGLREYLLPESTKELETGDNVEGEVVDKLISDAADRLLLEEISQYLEISEEIVHQVIPQLTYMIT